MSDYDDDFFSHDCRIVTIEHAGLRIECEVVTLDGEPASAFSGGSPDSTEVEIVSSEVIDGELLLLGMSEDGLLDEALDERLAEGEEPWSGLPYDEKERLLALAVDSWDHLIGEIAIAECW